MKPIFFAALLLCSFAHAQKVQEFDIIPGGKSSYPHYLYATSDHLYFYATDIDSGSKLHSMDKQGNISIVANIKKHNKGPLSYQRNILKEVDDIYFTAYDSASSGQVFLRDKLWVYNNGSYKKLADSASGFDASLPSHFVRIENKIYYWGVDSFLNINNHQLYEYNTSNKTLRQLTHHKKYYLGSVPKELVSLAVYNNKLYFTGYLDSTTSSRIPYGLYTYDPIKDTIIQLQFPDKSMAPLVPAWLKEFNNELYFITIDSNTTYYLSKCDSQSNIHIIDSFKAGGVAYSNKNTTPVELNGYLYIQGYDRDKQQSVLVQYDTLNNQFTYINYNLHNDRLDEMIVFNNKLYFTGRAYRYIHNDPYLMVYDGVVTPKTVPISLKIVMDLTVFNGDLYFTGIDTNNNGTELYRFDTTTLSIQKVIYKIDTKLYPNPAKDIVHLQFNLAESNTLNVTVADMQGRIVYMSEKKLYSIGDHTIDIPTNRLPAGSYIYRLNSESGILGSGKLIKQ